MTRRILPTALLALACGLAVTALHGAEEKKVVPAPKAPVLTAEQTQFFEKNVRPILASACYKCHSIEQNKAKAGLVLDTRDGMLKGGENGSILVPGDPAKSRFIQAITYADPDLQMPPKGEKLSDKEIAILTEWVKMGAPDPRVSTSGEKLSGLTDKARSHWAFQPVKKPEVPQTQNKTWAKTPIDSFILAGLEKNGMKPSLPANKETLIRRATFDLTGLPPTPEEVRAFVNDQSAKAFEKVIDRLMASPHYGERWGRFWLDSARYSDTTGAENNNRMDDYRYAHAWTYRDWVISAVNSDMPYDRFIKLQIAADQMSDSKERPEHLAALGYITVGKRFQNNNDTIDERIDSMTKSTMALTVACARCHDHKFDPIPTADYYSLHGVFASITEPADQPLIGGNPSGAEYQDYLKKMAAIEQKNRDIYYKIITHQQTEFRSKVVPYLLANLYGRGNMRDQIKERQELIEKYKLERDLYQGLRLVRPTDSVFAPLARLAQIPSDQFENKSKEVVSELATGKFQRKPINPLVAAAFKEASGKPFRSIRDVVEVYGKLFASIDEKGKAFVKANQNATRPTDKVSGFDDALVELLNVPSHVAPAHELDTLRLKELARGLPQQNSRLYNDFLFNNLNELELTHPGAPARAMIVADGQIRNSPIFIRGEAQNRGPVVPRQFLEIITGKDRKPFKQGAGRLELAQAIASKDNPLTARVAINRLWMRHFGEGFVRTVDDLGVQSESPSHPELLDYLASRFVEEGWSMKKMHKLVMLSAVYQQSSDTNKAYAEKDPDNRLLWRANLRRLDFEAIRDSLLQFTGKLDRTVGGKPVNLTDEPYSNRRSVYGYIDRGQMPELMQQFDFSDPDMTNTKRTSTIVPQQALFFMNSAMSVDVARKVTSRPEFVEAKDDYARVRAIYQVIFQRTPRPEEVKLAAEFYNSKVIADRGKGAQLASAPQPPRAAERGRPAPKKVDPMDDIMMRKGNGKSVVKNAGEIVQRRPLSIWEEYAQALLFSNEIVYVN